ncbi:hypothetical protein DICVIV_14310 [Dictyocaulus viviparus]|uniref:Uncharacterized protein n=1 Tax=Dictyocaulus viviparus TaxID=29172 RepID=A0A0D8XBG1_DICVI|nr:hypothetical protein DICVIV_14310 [Dictyocaulus viviparus]
MSRCWAESRSFYGLLDVVEVQRIFGAFFSSY